MADECDQAQRVETMLAAEAQASVAVIRQRLDGLGTDDCVDCGDEIPLARRKVIPSATRCAFCQDEIERR